MNQEILKLIPEKYKEPLETTMTCQQMSKSEMAEFGCIQPDEIEPQRQKNLNKFETNNKTDSIIKSLPSKTNPELDDSTGDIHQTFKEEPTLTSFKLFKN